MNNARALATGAKWTIGIGILMLLLAILLSSMAIFGWGFFQRATADFRGGTAELEQVKADPSHRISARQFFFDTCARVQTFEDAVTVLTEELDLDPSQEREEQIQGSITANRAQRAQLIRDYNTHAANFTFEQFRDADLPERLEVDAERTRCVAGD